MLLKRLYNHAAPRDDWKPRTRPCEPCQGKGVVVNAAGTGLDPCPNGCDKGTVTELIPPVRGIEFLRGGSKQRFSPGLLDAAEAEGWLRREGRKIVITPVTGDPVTYQIVQAPGYYCCHCGHPLDDGPDAQEHVRRLHAGVASPDKQNPAGYRRTHAYDCVREG